MPMILRLPALLCLGWILTACQGSFFQMAGGRPGHDSQAESMMRMHDYSGAMRRYQQLAQTKSYPDHYWLLATDAALRAGDGESAASMEQYIRPQNLEADDLNLYGLVKSRLDLNAGRAREAMARLKGILPEQLDTSDRINYYTLKASALTQLGDMQGSVRERIRLGPLLREPEAVERNNRAILDDLGRLPDDVLFAARPSVDEFGGWMALSQVVRKTPHEELARAVNDWRMRYPNHPAASGAFLEVVIADAASNPPSVRSATKQVEANALPSGPFLGVLLPLSGPYASVAEAVRTGMMAAQKVDSDPLKPQLHFIDSAQGDVNAQYRQLSEGGAIAVVGPLIKEDVAKLIEQKDITVPVLALNFSHGSGNPNVYQFSLAPEEEVDQVAGSAWLDGRQDALMLAPDTPFGERLTRHFEKYWRALGGRIELSRKYGGGEHDLESVLKLLASRDASSGSPFIFMIAEAREGHEMVPKLSAMGNRSPIYATSHLHQITDSGNTRDFDGVIFCDMPWLLDMNSGGATSARSMESEIRKMPGDAAKLIAMGLDAYRLVPVLTRMKTDPAFRFSGATGTLSLEADNHLQRQLDCAQFTGSGLVSKGHAPILKSSGQGAVSP